jgi:hypothetical protein
LSSPELKILPETDREQVSLSPLDQLKTFLKQGV